MGRSARHQQRHARSFAPYVAMSYPVLAIQLPSSPSSRRPCLHSALCDGLSCQGSKPRQNRMEETSADPPGTAPQQQAALAPLPPLEVPSSEPDARDDNATPLSTQTSPSRATATPTAGSIDAASPSSSTASPDGRKLSNGAGSPSREQRYAFQRASRSERHRSSQNSSRSQPPPWPLIPEPVFDEEFLAMIALLPPADRKRSVQRVLPRCKASYISAPPNLCGQRAALGLSPCTAQSLQQKAGLGATWCARRLGRHVLATEAFSSRMLHHALDEEQVQRAVEEGLKASAAHKTYNIGALRTNQYSALCSPGRKRPARQHLHTARPHVHTGISYL